MNSSIWPIAETLIVITIHLFAHSSKYCYAILIIWFNISHFFAHSQMVSSIVND